MTAQNPAPSPDNLRPGWSRPQPEHIPEPTLWPVALSLAVTLLFWGLVSSLTVTAIGLVLFIVSMAGWVKDIRHERRALQHTGRHE